MLLITNYQLIELTFAFILFIPFFFLYYKIQNIPVNPLNIAITAIFITLIIFLKDIVVNYNNLDNISNI
jgi:hypothetical protein